jgi:hypothetical protein
VPKVRAFVDFALPRLREAFERRRLAIDPPPEAPVGPEGP